MAAAFDSRCDGKLQVPAGALLVLAAAAVSSCLENAFASSISAVSEGRNSPILAGTVFGAAAPLSATTPAVLSVVVNCCIGSLVVQSSPSAAHSTDHLSSCSSTSQVIHLPAWQQSARVALLSCHLACMQLASKRVGRG